MQSVKSPTLAPKEKRLTLPASPPWLLRRLCEEAGGQDPTEYLTALLAQHESLQAAAAAIRVSPKTLYLWRRSYGFIDPEER
jgi:hypothetical protein